MSPQLARILRITARHWSLPRCVATVPAGAPAMGAPLRVAPVAVAPRGCRRLRGAA
ncbi:MAG: hypothetical protein M9907_16090 [Burkholderiaceae bacterium]|nr:hypothetical protein [Burkholderiaceae bacterium]MCO5108580.1 hypothetical protein [Burkholderiaceae bacterium]